MNWRILFFALFAISTLYNSAVYSSDDAIPDLKSKQSQLPTSAELNQYSASDMAAALIQNNPHFIAAVVPIVEISNGTQDWNKYYTCMMHMTNTTINYGEYSFEGVVQTWPGTKQLCPQSDNPHTGFHCENAVFLVREENWDKSEFGVIYYLLPYVREVDLIGHDTYSNYFDHIYLTGQSTIKGGRTANYYSILYVDASTMIYLNSASREERIDLSSAVESQKVSIKFFAGNNSIHGELAFDASTPAKLEWTNFTDETDSERTWLIYGREHMPDAIECSDKKIIELLRGRIQVNANGAGGNEENYDVITNCMISELNPFTNYIFTYPNTTYALTVNFDDSTSTSDSKKTHSTIELHENDVVLAFKNENYFKRIQSMKYSPWTNTLTLEIMWNNQTLMVLDVKGVLRNQTVNQFTGMNIFDSQLREYSALFILEESSTYNSIPVIRKPSEFNNDTVVDVTKFLMVKEANCTTIGDFRRVYKKVLADYDYTWHVEMIIKSKSKNEAFYIGSERADRVLILDSLKYIEGRNGSDTFILKETSQQLIWINNRAKDGLVDTLQLDSAVCNHPIIKIFIQSNQSLRGSKRSLVITCKSNSTSTILVLMKYLLNKFYRHLKIVRDNVEYAIVLNRNRSSGISEVESFELIEIIDLKSSGADVNRLITKPNSFWILFDIKKSEEITKYRKNSNFVISIKSMNASIELQNFFENENISTNWRNQFYVISDDLSDLSQMISLSDEYNKI